jgi:hypothetical protein
MIITSMITLIAVFANRYLKIRGFYFNFPPNYIALVVFANPKEGSFNF